METIKFMCLLIQYKKETPSFANSIAGNAKAKKKYMCVYCHMSKKSRVGWLGLIKKKIIIGKTGNSRSRFWNPIPVFHFRNFR